MNGSGSGHHSELARGRSMRSLDEISWEMPMPLSLPWGTVRARGRASIQVRSPERLQSLGTYDTQVASIQGIITQSLGDMLAALLSSGDQLPAQLWQIASATLVSANSKLYDYGAVLLDLSITEITTAP